MVSMQIACLINVTIGFRLLPFVYPALLEERIVSLFFKAHSIIYSIKEFFLVSLPTHRYSSLSVIAYTLAESRF